MSNGSSTGLTNTHTHPQADTTENSITIAMLSLHA